MMDSRIAGNRRYRGLVPTFPSRGWAEVSLPGWLWGAAPRQFFAEAGLVVRTAGAAGEPWRVQTEEGYVRRAASLVWSEDLAGPGCPSERIDRLADLSAGAGDYDPVEPNEVIERGIGVVHRRAEAERTPVAGFAVNQLVTGAVAGRQLPTVVREVWQDLRQVRLLEDGDERAFPHAGVHVVRRAPSFVHRVHLPLVLGRLDHDPVLAQADLRQVQQDLAAGRPVFESSRQLLDGLLIFDAYLGPLLGALSPFIWAVPAWRGLGAVIYSLGTTFAGTLGSAAEPLQLLRQVGPDTDESAPTLAPDAAAAALRWWTRALNDLFGVLTDPAAFTDSDRGYRPAAHLQALLTVEQLFRRVSSIQTSWRDTHARRALLFTVLDTLERLTGRDVEALCSLRRAQKVIGTLREAVPTDAATLLLPAADKAVAALREVQDGFFLRDPATSAIGIRHPDGDLEQLPPERASAVYVKMLRNATHGHGTNRDGARARTEALLASHSGHVPHDLALLGYLYLLDLLNRPEDLRRAWQRSAPR